MNKSKLPLNNRLSKKIDKEVHKAQGQLITPEIRADRDRLTAQEMLKKFPPKKKKNRFMAQLEAIKRKFLTKKKTAKESKRTTPGEVPSDSTPAHVHREDTSWFKTIVKQNVEKSRALNKKLSKKR